MKSIFKKIRLPRKVMFVLAGVLVLGGASGAYAVYSGKESFLGGENADEPALSGIACTDVETLKMRRNGQRWIRKYVSTESADGVDRVRTALRIAALLVKAEKADLYQVAILDQAGPTDRADRRGPAIGAEVLFAPDPSKVPGMKTPFVARYNSAKANEAGMFYGREIDLSTEEIKTTLTAMDDKSECFDPIAAAAAEAAAAGGGHGKVAPSEGSDAHGGEEAATGHGEAPAEHGEEAAAAAHGEEAASGHEESKAEDKGFLGSMLAMVWGGDEKPAEAAKPESGGHGAAEDGHGEAPAGHAEEAATPAHSDAAAPTHEESKVEEKGFFDSMKAMVLGDDEAGKSAAEAHGAAETGHGEEPAAHGEEAAAPVHGDQETHAEPKAESHVAAEPGHGEQPAAHGEEAAVPVHGADATPANEGHGTAVESDGHGAETAKPPAEADGHQESAEAH